MSFATTPQYHAHVIAIKGRFIGVVEKQSWLRTIESYGQAPRIIIDLEKTDFMDSSAVGLLIGTAKAVREQGGEIVLANLKKRIKNLFLMMHLLGKVFINYKSVAEAEQHFVAVAA